MKNVLFAILLAASFGAQAAPVITLGAEYDYENIEGSSDNNNAFSFIPGIKLDNGVKIDVKFTGAQDDESNDTIVAFEPRVQYLLPVTKELSLGGRASVGQVLNNGGDYTFYTLEPMAGYAFTNKITGLASLKYTDTTGDKENGSATAYYGQTVTTYVGAAYKVTDSQTATAKVYTRNYNGDRADSNGIEVNYTVAF